MHQNSHAKNTAGTIKTKALKKEDEVIGMNRRELRELIKRVDRQEDNDDFYREAFIEEQLDNDCLDDEESAFMMGYLAA
jgi:hypothetical protein